MPRYISLCIEHRDAADEGRRFFRCVAKAGRGDGLAVGEDGEVSFGSNDESAFELVVSMDERLMLVRREGAPAVVVERAGRRLEAAAGDRVVLVDQDLVTVGDRRLRVHVHGYVSELHAPKPLVPRSLRAAASVAAVVALGAAGSGCKEIASLFDGGPIDVRTSPPEPPPAPPRVDASVSASTSIVAPAASSAELESAEE